MAAKKKSAKSAAKASSKSATVVAYVTVNAGIGGVYAAGVTPGFGDKAAARQLSKVRARAGGNWSDAHELVVDGKGNLSIRPIG